MAIGTEAWWDASERVVRCLPCVDRPVAPQVPLASQGSDTALGPEVPDGAAAVVKRTEAERAGASAREMYERRAGREQATNRKVVDDDLAWRRATVERRPVLGRLTTAVTPRPTIAPEKQSTTSWRIGAEGEERVAEVLGPVDGIEVLHDRRVPGSRANIDHIVVGPAGVFVIDAKKYKEGSKVEVRDVGPLWRTDLRLYVRDRDRTKLVDGVCGQVEVVRTALGPDLEDVPVRGVLCFVGARWGWPKRTKTVRGVTAVWPVGLPGLVTRKGPCGSAIESVAAHLRVALPPAVR